MTALMADWMLMIVSTGDWVLLIALMALMADWELMIMSMGDWVLMMASMSDWALLMTSMDDWVLMMASIADCANHACRLLTCTTHYHHQLRLAMTRLCATVNVWLDGVTFYVGPAELDIPLSPDYITHPSRVGVLSNIFQAVVWSVSGDIQMPVCCVIG